MSKKFELIGNALRDLKRLVLGSDEMRQYREVLLNLFVYEDEGSFEAQYDEAQAFYERLLIEGGFEPARSPIDIDNAVRASYVAQFDGMRERLAHRDQMRAQARANQPVRPIPGSDEHMRQEAEKTFAATGVYGLPNSGGYVLTKADKERLGLLY